MVQQWVTVSGLRRNSCCGALRLLRDAARRREAHWIPGIWILTGNMTMLQQAQKSASRHAASSSLNRGDGIDSIETGHQSWNHCPIRHGDYGCADRFPAAGRRSPSWGVEKRLLRASDSPSKSLLN